MVTIPTYKPEDIFQGTQSFAVDAKGQLSLSAKFDEKNAAKVVALFLDELEKLRADPDSLPSDVRGRMFQTIDLYFKALSSRYQDKLEGGLSACKSNPLLMSLVKLDRYIAAHKFASLQSSQPLSAERVEQLFVTKPARQQMSKWLSEITHRANAHSLTEQEHKVVHSEHSAAAFLRNPHEVDFITSSYLHKQIARINEHIEIDPTTLHHQIRFKGTVVNVEEVAKQFKIDEKGKLFSIEDGKRYFYCQDTGLREYDPENWQELPAYRKREHARSEDDYRLVIKTIINEKRDDKHSWIELKSPTSVYNVGYFWNDQDFLPAVQRFTTLRGQLHAIDKNELLGHEEDVTKTVCRISKDQFETLKKEIEAFQNKAQPKMFNLITSSCSTWTHETLAHVGLNVASKENGTRFLTGKHFEFKHPADTILGKIERAFHHTLAVLRNLVIYLFGGANSILSRDKFDNKDLAFRSFSEVFDTKKGFFDFPMRIREWQEAVAARRKEKEEVIRASEPFTTLTEEDQEIALETVRYALPTDVTLPEPEMTF